MQKGVGNLPAKENSFDLLRYHICGILLIIVFFLQKSRTQLILISSPGEKRGNRSAKLGGSGISLQRKTLTTRKNFMG